MFPAQSLCSMLSYLFWDLYPYLKLDKQKSHLNLSFCFDLDFGKYRCSTFHFFTHPFHSLSMCYQAPTTLLTVFQASPKSSDSVRLSQWFAASSAELGGQVCREISGCSKKQLIPSWFKPV